MVARRGATSPHRQKAGPRSNKIRKCPAPFNGAQNGRGSVERRVFVCSRDVIYSLALNVGVQTSLARGDQRCGCSWHLLMRPLRKTHNNVPFTGQMMSNCDEELGQEG